MKPNYYGRRQKGLPINGKQITIIKMAVNHLGIDDAAYRMALDDSYGVRSCKDLTYDQASDYIKELERKGFTLIPNKTGKKTKPAAPPRQRIPRKGNVIALVTPEEIDKLNAVAALIKWREENGLALFLAKRMGIKGGVIRTGQECYLAIEGLKKMFGNWQKKSGTKINRVGGVTGFEILAVARPTLLIWNCRNISRSRWTAAR
jgi:hypothetical protein